MHFRFFTTKSVLRHTTVFAAVARYIIEHCSMKQADLYYFEALKITSQAWLKLTENTRLWLVFFIQNFTGLVTSFLWLQNSIDKAAS